MAKNLYWEILDWNLFENYRIIQVDDLRIQELSVQASKSAGDSISLAKKDLPVINIGRLDIDTIHFIKYNGPTDRILFQAGNICLDNIRTCKQFFTWENAQADFSRLLLDSVELQQPSIIVFQNGPKKGGSNRPVVLPFQFETKKLTVNDDPAGI